MNEVSKGNNNERALRESSEKDKKTHPLGLIRNTAFKHIEKQYSDLGVPLGFERNKISSQIVMIGEFEKINKFWLQRGTKNPKKRS